MFELRSPTGLDKFEIELLVRSVDFVADDRAAKRGEMHPNLVRAPGPGDRADQSELISMEFCFALTAILSLRKRKSRSGR